MIISSAIMVISGAGAAFIIGRHLRRARSGEMAHESISDHSMFEYVYSAVTRFILRLWRKAILPSFFNLSQKAILKLEIITKKIEKILERMDSYMRGRYKAHIFMNGSNDSKYWGDVKEFKNGLNGNSKKGNGAEEKDYQEHELEKED